MQQENKGNLYALQNILQIDKSTPRLSPGRNNWHTPCETVKAQQGIFIIQTMTIKPILCTQFLIVTWQNCRQTFWRTIHKHAVVWLCIFGCSKKDCLQHKVPRRPSRHSDHIPDWTTEDSWFDFRVRARDFSLLRRVQTGCTGGSFTRDKAAWAGGAKAGQWSYTSTSQYAFMACTGNILQYKSNLKF